MISKYQVCTRCVMDTTDPEITFDENGVCNHCHYFDREVKPRWFPNEEGKRRLEGIVDRIKEENRNKQYDCIIGLSGGVDSSYLALKVHELGLRPLVVHVDGGWNSELAVHNIKVLLDYCGWDLVTVVIDWEEMRDLQIAYLKSGVSNQDVPQDHAFFASLYKYAVKNHIRYVLSGGNIATEAIFPRSWHYPAMDSRNLKAIHKKYGHKPLKTFPTISFWQYYFYFPFVKKMHAIRPLNYMPYSRKKAIEELEEIGWRNYGRKHGESVFTKFFQNYYLPKRYGYDKRRPHLSSMILSGEITREEAIRELDKPLYEENELQEDRRFIEKKLGLTEDEFTKLLEAPLRQATDFASYRNLYVFMKKAQRFAEKHVGKKLAKYS